MTAPDDDGGRVGHVDGFAEHVCADDAHDDQVLSGSEGCKSATQPWATENVR